MQSGAGRGYGFPSISVIYWSLVKCVISDTRIRFYINLRNAATDPHRYEWFTGRGRREVRVWPLGRRFGRFAVSKSGTWDYWRPDFGPGGHWEISLQNGLSSGVVHDERRENTKKLDKKNMKMQKSLNKQRFENLCSLKTDENDWKPNVTISNLSMTYLTQWYEKFYHWGTQKGALFSYDIFDVNFFFVKFDIWL